MLIKEFMTRFLSNIANKKAALLLTLYALILIALSISKSMGWFKSDIRFMQSLIGGDKLTHLFAMVVLGLISSLLVNYASKRWLTTLARIFLLLAGLLFVDEFLQIFFKNRVFDMHDLYYGWIGALLGLTLGGVINFVLKKIKKH